MICVIVILSARIYGQSFVNILSNKTIFENFAEFPLVDKYSEVSSIKLVYDLGTKEIYYINSRYYTYHYEFCINKLEPDVDLEYFNKINYSNDSKRKYLLANINYYKPLNIYAIEISPVDQMTLEHIILLWNIVSKTTFIGNDLHLLLNNTRLQNIYSSDKLKVPVINPSEIYNNLNYQAISKHKSCGRLNFIHHLESEKDNINPTDIIVLNETPLVLPRVAGIITNEFQTPLSHLTILGQNRKIPICAFKSAFVNKSLLNLNKKNVCFNVMSDTFNIEMVDKFEKQKLNHKKIKLKFDLSVDSIVNIEFLNKKSYKYAGYKAHNLGILYQLSKLQDFKVPECAFVIPFYFYFQHIQNSNAKLLIDSINIKSNCYNSDSIKLILKKIREQINSAPLDSSLINSVNRKVTNCNWSKMRFRSSTNSEDNDGFSGAGLYTSKTGILDDNEMSFEKAIKKVWASLWSYEAFSEREYYNIDHKFVYMGVLVHRSFPNEEVNGVAITKNLYRPNNYGFVINAQLKDESVVKPKKNIKCDQLICFPNNANYIYNNKNAIDIITQSSLNNNKLVMSETEIQNLANQLELIKMYFIKHTNSHKTFLDFGLDIEFKLVGEKRTLYLKQVRLYND